MSDITIAPFLNKVDGLILNPIIWLLFVISTIYFIWGVVKFLSTEPGDKNKIDARNAIIWGIVGMIIMFSVHGLIKFVLGTFGISSSDVGSTANQFLK